MLFAVSNYQILAFLPSSELPLRDLGNAASTHDASPSHISNDDTECNPYTVKSVLESVDVDLNPWSIQDDGVGDNQHAAPLNSYQHLAYRGEAPNIGSNHLMPQDGFLGNRLSDTAYYDRGALDLHDQWKTSHGSHYGVTLPATSTTQKSNRHVS
jgi:hypothetical protein